MQDLIDNTIQVPKVGFVIPAYNAEKYIQQCIESILSQTYKNIVIAIINDGSTDNTWDIIKKFMINNPYIIRGINSDNHGVMLARFTGITHLNDCDYILFVDADDYLIDKSILNKCVENMKSSDMVCFNAEQNGKPCFRSTYIQHLGRKEALRNILNRKYFDGNMWGSCYKYWYVKKYFQVMMCNNDDYINKAAFINVCNRITVIPDIGYYYRINNESQTHTEIKESDYMFYKHASLFCQDIIQHYPEFKEETDYFESWVLLWLVTGMNKTNASQKLNIYKSTMQDFILHSKIYLTNKYFSKKDRLTYLCIRFHIFRILYNIYHKF